MFHMSVSKKVTVTMTQSPTTPALGITDLQVYKILAVGTLKYVTKYGNDVLEEEWKWLALAAAGRAHKLIVAEV